YLTANAPWKKPAERSDEDHAALQARVLANAAEAIRIITALVYPILPDAAAKVWQQLGQGEIANAAEGAFLASLSWGGLKAGTQFADPAPLFPRAEKDAVARMQQIEEDNSKSVIEAATCGEAGGGFAATTADSVKGTGFSPHIQPATSTGALTPEGRSLENTSPRFSTSKSIPAPQTQPAPSQVTKTNQKEAIMREETAEQKEWDKVPVDSIGAQGEEEARAYETVAQASAPVPSEAAATSPAAQAASASPQVITIDDVIKVDLRVAQILVAERVPKADKLLRLEVDLGYEKRQILAGIAQYYEPEKLVGRKIIIVANLAPRKMRGLESNGMLLAASLEGGAPVLAGFLEDVPLGARLK
ncbi:MAG TPA: methionine--tRNA ligase subunit beta, partial [Terracidiphilus sp.]